MRITYCPICEKRLRSYGDVTFTLYQAICEGFILRDEELLLETLEKLREIVRYLETKGFIVTTECSKDSVSAKPASFVKIAEEDYHFCSNLKKHGSRNV